MAKIVHAGEYIDYVPAADTTAGAVVVIGDLVGIATEDLAAGRLGCLCIEGVAEFATNGANAIAAGAACHWKASDSTADDAATVGPFLGSAVPKAGSPTVAAASDDTVVRVKLNHGRKRAAVVAALAQTISGSYTQAEVQAISTKVDAILSALKTAGLMANA